MRTTMMLIVLAASLAACKWTEFDDLSGQTWVDSTQKPNVKSSDYGVAIQRGAVAGESGSSGTVAVIGAGPGTYSELQYDASGSASFQPNSLTLAAQGIMTLDSPPIWLADPASSEVALVTTGDNASIVVATGVHTLTVRQLFVGRTTLGTSVTIMTTPDAATYMQPLPFPGIATPPKHEPLVAVGDVVMGTVYGLDINTTMEPACRLTSGPNPVQVRALGAVANGVTDDVLVWNGTDGKLLRYSGTVFNGCTTASPTVTGTASPLLPAKGSQILTIDANRVLLQGHQDPTKGTGGFLQVYSSTTLAPIGGPVSIDGVRSAAVLTTETGTYAVAGYPGASLAGTSSGEVMVFRIDATGLQTAAPVATLRDAQPDNNELFGRSVAVVPFRDKQVIAVAADNEIFMYFRANLTDGTPLYGETRQGR